MKDSTASIDAVQGRRVAAKRRDNRKFHDEEDIPVTLNDFAATSDPLRGADTDSMDPSNHANPSGGVVKILIGTDEKRVADQTIQALAGDPNLYRMGDALAVARGDDPPKVRPITKATLRERIASRVQFQQKKPHPNGDDFLIVPVHPPDWCVSAIQDRGDYPGILPIEGVIEAPTMRLDGSILATPGYDAATRLLYVPNAAYVPIPVAPTRARAEAARDELLGLTTDFPWRSNVDRSVWLSALLTVIGRAAFDGPAPLFGFDANCPGVGKGLLVELITVIATGRRMSPDPVPVGRSASNEWEKFITAIALQGRRMAILDNVNEPLGGQALDKAITATRWSGRILGESRVVDVPLRTVWIATGNNLACQGDAHRRVLLARLETAVENPEDRSRFKYPRLIEHAMLDRGRLVSAALVILLAYHQAGRPDPIQPLGSFEAWSDVIGSAVAWITGVNPADARKATRADEPEANRRTALVAGWAELPRAEVGLTVAEALKHLKARGAEDKFQTLRYALMELSDGADLPSAKSIGKRLRAVKDRVIDGLVLRGKPNRTRVMEWRVEKPVLPNHPADDQSDGSADDPDPAGNKALAGASVAGFAEFENKVRGLDAAQTLHFKPSDDKRLCSIAGFAEYTCNPLGGIKQETGYGVTTNAAKLSKPCGGHQPVDHNPYPARDFGRIHGDSSDAGFGTPCSANPAVPLALWATDAAGDVGGAAAALAGGETEPAQPPRGVGDDPAVIGDRRVESGREDHAEASEDDPARHRKPRGGRLTRPLIVCCSESDRLLLTDHLGDHADVMAVGGGAGESSREVMRAAGLASAVYLAHDADEAGDRAASLWPSRAIRVRPPEKDWRETLEKSPGMIAYIWGRYLPLGCPPKPEDFFDPALHALPPEDRNVAEATEERAAIQTAGDIEGRAETVERIGPSLPQGGFRPEPDDEDARLTLFAEDRSEAEIEAVDRSSGAMETAWF